MPLSNPKTPMLSPFISIFNVYSSYRPIFTALTNSTKEVVTCDTCYSVHNFVTIVSSVLNTILTKTGKPMTSSVTSHVTSPQRTALGVVENNTINIILGIIIIKTHLLLASHTKYFFQIANERPQLHQREEMVLLILIHGLNTLHQKFTTMDSAIECFCPYFAEQNV